MRERVRALRWWPMVRTVPGVAAGGKSVPSLVDVWNVTRLRLLIELEKSSSLSKAAEAIGISQPSASEHIRMLNVAAGEPLVSRSGRSLRLTSAGRLVSAHAAQALTSLMAAESDLAARAGLRTGTLRLGASSVPGTYVVPDALAHFQQQCPDVEVHLSVGSTVQVAQWLLSGRVTCAITCGEVRDERLTATTLGPDEIVGVSSPSFLDLSSTGEVTTAALDGATLLVQEEGSSTRDFALGILTGTAYRFGDVWELGSVDAVKRAVRRGRGVGFLSTHTVVEERRRGEIVAFRVEDVTTPRRQVSLLRVGQTTASPAERYLETVLRSHLGRSTGAAAIV
jgi:DNA-binding transcriptional LysR family regulator